MIRSHVDRSQVLVGHARAGVAWHHCTAIPVKSAKALKLLALSHNPHTTHKQPCWLTVLYAETTMMAPTLVRTHYVMRLMQAMHYGATEQYLAVVAALPTCPKTLLR